MKSRWQRWRSVFMLLAPLAASGADSATSSLSPQQIRIGDVVFIRVAVLPFEKVADTTQSWTNHVGIVIDVSGSEPLVAESAFPFSRTTPISKFIARSQEGRVAVKRLDHPLTADQERALTRASEARLGVFYDTGFDLASRRQFCSRFVREVVAESTGVSLGDIETFSDLLARNPHADLMYWRAWYFGRIPWDRQTVTPASLLRDARLQPVFDGYARHSRT